MTKVIEIAVTAILVFSGFIAIAVLAWVIWSRGNRYTSRKRRRLKA